MKRVHRTLLAFLILISLSLVIITIKPNQTGLVIYGGQDSNSSSSTKIWNFSNSEEYLYNNSEITLEGNKAHLKNITTITNWYETTYHGSSLVYALYDPEDKTSSVTTIDNNYISAKSDKFLNIFFENNLENGDSINFNLKSGDPANITLCDINTMCTSQEYGSLSFNGTAGNYSITLSSLGQQRKSFNIKSGDVKINYISSSNGNLTKALFDASDKTSKVVSKDGENFEISKNKLFDIKFNSSLENNDTIVMYLKSGSASGLYLCNTSEECSSPGYGNISYDGNEGWYNITLTGLESVKNSFNLNPENVKVDFIKAVHMIKTENSSTNTSYVKNSTIQTKDIKKIKNIISIEISEEINNQSIEYRYSSDKGLTWNTIPNNVSDLNVNEIRFSATLLSDGKSTSAISEIKLVYDKIQPKIYYEINNSGLINASSYEPITINNSNFLLNLTLNQDVTNANISIREFTNSSMEILKPLRSFMDIDIDENIRNNLNESLAKIQYSDNDISSRGLNESSLKIYYYNESNNTWMPIASEVDITNNIVKATLTHFSIYGVFGSEISQSSSQQSGSSGSSGYYREQRNNYSIDLEKNETESTIPEKEIENLSPETQEPVNAMEIDPTVDKKEQQINSTKEKGITGFATKMGGLGVGNVIAVMMVSVLLGLYLVHKIHKKQPS